MCDVMQGFIYLDVDLFCFGVCYVILLRQIHLFLLIICHISKIILGCIMLLAKLLPLRTIILTPTASAPSYSTCYLASMHNVQRKWWLGVAVLDRIARVPVCCWHWPGPPVTIFRWSRMCTGWLGRSMLLAGSKHARRGWVWKQAPGSIPSMDVSSVGEWVHF